MESIASKTDARGDEWIREVPSDSISMLSQLSRKKLDELLEHKCEADTLDYKEEVDLNDNRSRVELAKDILAMTNTHGGHIVIGMEDETWRLVGVKEQHLNQFKDSKSVMDKLRRYCGPPVTVHCNKHQVGDLWIVLLYVPPSKKPVLAADDGIYSDPCNPKKQKWVFRRLDVYERKSDSSVRVEDFAEFLTRFDLPARSKALGAKPRGKKNPVPLRPAMTSAPINNPYDFTNIASRHLFKGRREDIAQLIDNIRSGTHTAVFGLQRMGKTSLVEHVMKEVLPQRDELRNSTIYAKIDFQKTAFSKYRDLFDLFLKAIADQFKSDQLRNRADYIIDDFANQATLPALTDRRRLFEPFATALKRLVELAHGKRIVLFLDEFSEWCWVIEKNEKSHQSSGLTEGQPLHQSLVDVDLMQFFSSLMRDQDFKNRLVFVFAVRPFMAEYDSRRNLQILKLADSITLYYLDKCSALSLITEPLADTLRIKPSAAAHLYESTAGHPYLIQFILKKVVDKCAREQQQVVTKQMIMFHEDYMTREGPAYEGLFRVLDSDYSIEYALSTDSAGLGWGLLALIAKLGTDCDKGWATHGEVRAQMMRRGCNQAQTDKLLDQLVRAKILEQCQIQEDLCFRMVIPLLRRRYIEQNFFLKHFKGSQKH